MAAKKKELKPETKGKKPATKGKKAAEKADFSNIAMTSEALANAALAIQQTLKELELNHKKTPLAFATLDDIKASFVPFDNIYLEHMWGTRGLPEKTLGEIIGPEGIGKTTLAFYLIGRGLRMGCPALYLETESKPMLKDRVKRNFSFVKSEADEMLKRVTTAQVFTLDDMVTHIEAWSQHVREVQKLPKNIPGIIVVDTWSKLMSNAEALGYYEDNPEMMDTESKKKRKDVGEASNLGHSKFAHSWCRRLPFFFKLRNMILILVEHQNEDVVMAQGPRSARAKTGLYNKKKVGGRAFNQNAAWQLILETGDTWKSSDKTMLLGHDVRARMDKNSYGARGRTCQWKIRNEQMQDTPEELAPAIWFDFDAARWLVDSKMIGATVNNARYTCAALDVSAVVAPVLWAKLYTRPDVVGGLGRALKIAGYEIEEIR